MSSLNDPFDLIKTTHEMDNIVPFLPPQKVHQMVESALLEPQIQSKPSIYYSTPWKYRGVGIAVCLAVFMLFLAPTYSPPYVPFIQVKNNPDLTADDMTELSELMILENWEEYTLPPQ